MSAGSRAALNILETLPSLVREKERSGVGEEEREGFKAIPMLLFWPQ